MAIKTSVRILREKNVDLYSASQAVGQEGWDLPTLGDVPRTDDELYVVDAERSDLGVIPKRETRARIDEWLKKLGTTRRVR